VATSRDWIGFTGFGKVRGNGRRQGSSRGRGIKWLQDHDGTTSREVCSSRSGQGSSKQKVGAGG
jgi:hypothetical protein